MGCTWALSCPAAPPCTPASPTGCRRRSPPSPPPPSRSRSSLPPRGSTPYGSVAPSSPPCPPSSRCGSPSRRTTSAAPPSSTASASKLDGQPSAGPPSGSAVHIPALYTTLLLAHCLYTNCTKTFFLVPPLDEVCCGLIPTNQFKFKLNK